MKAKLLTLLLLPFLLAAQTPTVGLIQHTSGSYDNGCVLFPPFFSDTTYLIDKCGKKVHQWPSSNPPGLSVYLLSDGSLLRSEAIASTTFNTFGSRGGRMEKIDWNGNITWSYTISDAFETQNHDILPLPNGNILVCIWVNMSPAQATAAGRDPSILGTQLWSARVKEIQPVGTNSATVVWQWDLWDHLIQEYDNTKANYGVVADHPELLNLNFNSTNTATEKDWIHLNGIAYNQQLDQVMISSHNLHEIYILDHSTTTAQAATHTGGTYGKGGDFLYRWGNPQAYNRGTSSDRKFYYQHNPTWVPQGMKDAGKIMIFNNGQGRPGGNASSVEIIVPPMDANGNYTVTTGQAFGPVVQDWIYMDPTPTNFYSQNMGGAQRLANGNTLICNAANGTFFEIDSMKNIVWKYINPCSSSGTLSQGTAPNLVQSFRSEFYTNAFLAATGKPIVSGNPIERNPYLYNCTNNVGIKTTSNAKKITVSPNPSSGIFHIKISDAEEIRNVEVFNSLGEKIISSGTNVADLTEKATGIYLLKVELKNGSVLTSEIIRN
ncbi:MAG: aryl-sulfate sulfotransferase [Bacteroidia bacterium]